MTTHLAGPVVGFGRRFLQRCAVCGDKLIDYDVGLAMVPGPRFFNIGTLVEVQQTGEFTEMTAVGELGMHNLPANFCLQLVER